MNHQNRWLVLAASVLANLCIGSAYAWSVFQKPLIQIFGWSTTQASLAFTLSLSLVPFAMIIAGRIQDKKGPRWVIFSGGLIFGLGIFLTSFTTNLTILYLTYGLLGGAGIGFIYGCTVPNTVKWFPDKRGMAGGLIAGGFGMGAVVFGPVSASLIASNGVLSTFKLEGIIYAVVVCLASLFIIAPQAGYKPAGWEPPVPAAGTAAPVSMTTGEMLRTSKFWILWSMYAIGCVAGLMIIGHASPIGQEKIGLTPAVAAGAVAFLALANTCGRMFWGAVSDKIGRYNALMLMYLVNGGMLLLLNSATGYGMFVVAIMGIALSFGGFLGIFPSVTADNFGTKSLGTNYGVMFIAYGLAAFVGPRLAASVKQSSGGDYSLAFIIASAMSIVGILLTFYISNQIKKQKTISA